MTCSRSNGNTRPSRSRRAALRRCLRVLRGAALVITNRLLHVAMPCFGLGVPVIMVEASDLPFRLTALPPWLRIWRESELRSVKLDPAKHRTEEWLGRRQAWRTMVRERLRTNVG